MVSGDGYEHNASLCCNNTIYAKCCYYNLDIKNLTEYIYYVYADVIVNIVST